MTAYKPAARVGDDIAHLGTLGGLLGGLVGVAAGAGIVVGVGFLVAGTGGLAGVGLGSLLAAGGTALTTDGVLTVLAFTVGVGRSMGESMQGSSVQGHITGGSPSVRLGPALRRAARASANDPKTTVDCHSSAFVVEGSKTVHIDRCPASRVDDRTSCNGKIASGEASVLVGGDKTQLPAYRELGDERRPLWYRAIFFGLELYAQVRKGRAAETLLGRVAWLGEFLPFLYSQEPSLPGADRVGAAGGVYGLGRSSWKYGAEFSGLSRARRIGTGFDVFFEGAKTERDLEEAFPRSNPSGGGSPGR